MWEKHNNDSIPGWKPNSASTLIPILEETHIAYSVNALKAFLHFRGGWRVAMATIEGVWAAQDLKVSLKSDFLFQHSTIAKSEKLILVAEFIQIYLWLNECFDFRRMRKIIISWSSSSQVQIKADGENAWRVSAKVANTMNCKVLANITHLHNKCAGRCI